MSNLSEQFMPITQLRNMKANDFASDQYSEAGKEAWGKEGIGPEHFDISVGQLTRNHPAYANPRHHSYDWDRLSHDYDTGEADQPLVIGKSRPAWNPDQISDPEDRLLNGHHRAIMAMEKGRMFVPVTDIHTRESTQLGKYEHVQPKSPARTWEPLLQEHEAEHEQAAWQKAKGTPVHYGQGVLFNDRRD
jgi:hypothetical protein